MDAPTPVIGPIAVVPNPTFLTFTYSSLILKISSGPIVLIPLRAKYVDAVPIWPPFPDKVCDIGV